MCFASRSNSWTGEAWGGKERDKREGQGERGGGREGGCVCVFVCDINFLMTIKKSLKVGKHNALRETEREREREREREKFTDNQTDD